MKNNTDIKTVDYSKKEIVMSIPVTVTGGKFRFYKENGSNIRPCGEGFTTSGDFCEWQIGHDAIANDEKAERSTLRDFTFKAWNKKDKVLYELAEIVYYFRQFGYVSNDELKDILNELESIPNDKFISESPEYAIRTGKESEIEIGDIKGSSKERIHKDCLFPLDFGWWIDVKIDKRQKATGVQPMLYVCIPIDKLNESLAGRKATKKEIIDFTINKGMVNNFMCCIKLLGYLSIGNNFDAREIIKTILENS